MDMQGLRGFERMAVGQRIVQQHREQVAEAGLVEHRRRQRSPFDHGALRRHALRQPLRQHVHHGVDILAAHLAARLARGQIQLHVAHQVAQSRGIAFDIVERIAHFLVAAQVGDRVHALAQVLAVAREATRRLHQVVRRNLGETGQVCIGARQCVAARSQPALGGLQFVQHPVEIFRQRADLVFAGNRRARIATAGVYLVGHGHQLMQPPGHPAGQRQRDQHRRNKGDAHHQVAGQFDTAQVVQHFIATETDAHPADMARADHHRLRHVYHLIAVEQHHRSRRERLDQPAAQRIADIQADVLRPAGGQHPPVDRQHQRIAQTAAAPDAGQHLLQTDHVAGQHPGGAADRHRMGQALRGFDALVAQEVALLLQDAIGKQQHHHPGYRGERQHHLPPDRGEPETAQRERDEIHCASSGRTSREKVSRKERTTS